MSLVYPNDLPEELPSQLTLRSPSQVSLCRCSCTQTKEARLCCLGLITPISFWLSMQMSFEAWDLLTMAGLWRSTLVLFSHSTPFTLV